VQLAAVQAYLERTRALRHAAARRPRGAAERTESQLARLLYLQQLPLQCAKVLEDMGGSRVATDADSLGLLSAATSPRARGEAALAPLARPFEPPDGSI
jgi:hypothetical protein